MLTLLSILPRILVIIRLVYSLILFGGTLYPMGIAPPSRHFTLWEFRYVGLVLLHIVLTWVVAYAPPFHKTLLTINLSFHLTVVVGFLWLMFSNDFNGLIGVWLCCWTILVIWSLWRWHLLAKRPT